MAATPVPPPPRAPAAAAAAVEIAPRALARRGERPKAESISRAQSSLSWRGGTGAAQSVELKIAGVPISVAQEPGREVADRGTGGTVWNCAFVMAKYLERLAEKEGEAWRSLRVLELGSGTGVVGIAATILFRPTQMLLTDLPAQLPLIETNLAAARVNTQGDTAAALQRVQIGTLDWAAPKESPGAFDVLLASDCVWPKVDNSLFVNALQHLATPRTRIILAYEYRGESCRHTFFAPAERLFHFQRIPDSELHRDYRTDDIELYYLTKRSEPVTA